MAVATPEKALPTLSICALSLPGRVRRQGTTTARSRGWSMETPLFLLLPSGGSQGVLLGALPPRQGLPTGGHVRATGRHYTTTHAAAHSRQ